MKAYFEVTVCFVILGCYSFMLFRWWCQRLMVLAAHYDLAERRRHASSQTLFVVLLYVIPTLTVLIGSMIHPSVSGFFIICLQILSVIPATIWYVRRLPSLRALGFYSR